MHYLPAPRSIQLWRPARNHIYDMDALQLLGQLPDASVDLILTDPPYGVLAGIVTWDAAPNMGAFWEVARRVMKPGGVVVIMAQQPFATDVIASNRQWFRYEIIANKRVATGWLDVKVRPLRSHENILVFSDKQYISVVHTDTMYYEPQMARGKAYQTHRGGKYDGYNGERIPTDNKGWRYPRTVIDWDNHNAGSIHPTQKPVGGFAYLIRTYCPAGGLVVDPFVGSGTTALAALQTGRDYICGDYGTCNRTGKRWAQIARERVANADPFQHKNKTNGAKQLSLFAAGGD